MSFLKAITAAALIAGVSTPASAVTNLVANGGFEAGSFISWTGTSTGLNGFTTTTITSVPADVFAGTFAARLRTITPNVNTLAQTITTINARPYVLSYMVRNADNQGRVIDNLTVTSGTTVTVFGDRPSFAYTPFSQYFVANAASSVISFAYQHTSPAFFLDEVVVTMVPEPATWGLMLAGFGMVGFAMRRRSRAVAA